MDQWQNLSNRWSPEIWLPVLVWSLIGGLYLLKLFPVLTRVGPLEWFFRSYYRALSLRGLATIAAMDPQLSSACRAGSEATPAPLWSRRLGRAAQRIDAGETPGSALLRARVLRRHEARALALADNPETLSWALSEIAESASRRVVNRTSVVVQVAVVAIVLTSASVVCFMGLAIMTTLAEWITVLA